MRFMDMEMKKLAAVGGVGSSQKWDNRWNQTSTEEGTDRQLASSRGEDEPVDAMIALSVCPVK